MKRWVVVLCALGAVLLGGCDPQSAMKAMIPDQQERIARHLIDELRAGDIGVVENQISAEVKGPATHDTLQKARSFFPAEPPKSVKVVGYHFLTVNGVTTYNFTFEYEFSHRWLLAWTNFKPSGGKVEIMALGIEPLADSLENANAFRLSGKSLQHYVFLALVVAAVLFSIVTLVVCLMTRVPRYKWAWIIAIVLGVTQFKLNWTTGAIEWHVLGLQLLSAGFVQGFYGPLMLELGVPLGAMMFWGWRSGWSAQKTRDEHHES
jgi:hypothetical protein